MRLLRVYSDVLRVVGREAYAKTKHIAACFSPTIRDVNALSCGS